MKQNSLFLMSTKRSSDTDGGLNPPEFPLPLVKSPPPCQILSPEYLTPPEGQIFRKFTHFCLQYMVYLTIASRHHLSITFCLSPSVLVV